jgi:hypothetical protein
MERTHSIPAVSCLAKHVCSVSLSGETRLTDSRRGHTVAQMEPTAVLGKRKFTASPSNIELPNGNEVFCRTRIPTVATEHAFGDVSLPTAGITCTAHAPHQPSSSSSSSLSIHGKGFAVGTTTTNERWRDHKPLTTGRESSLVVSSNNPATTTSPDDEAGLSLLLAASLLRQTATVYTPHCTTTDGTCTTNSSSTTTSPRFTPTIEDILDSAMLQDCPITGSSHRNSTRRPPPNSERQCPETRPLRPLDKLDTNDSVAVQPLPPRRLEPTDQDGTYKVCSCVYILECTVALVRRTRRGVYWSWWLQSWHCNGTLDTTKALVDAISKNGISLLSVDSLTLSLF